MKKAFLFLLGLIVTIGAWAQTSPYKGSEAAAGDFYIYNVETGYWLQNNNRVNDWNSQVQVDVQGFDWELIALDDDTWQLNPKFGNNHSLNSGDDNGYMDTGQPVSAWTLTPANDGNNGYMISSNGTTLGVNRDTKLLTKDGSGATTWQLVTAAERLSVLNAQAESVTAGDPVDITWMIPGANMNIADDRFSQLIITYPDNASAQLPTRQGNNPGNCVREIWNNHGPWNIGYTLTGLPAGVYRFVVSGFYRDGATLGNEELGTTGIGDKVADGTEEIRANIYINENTKPMMSVCQRTASGNGCNVKTGNFYVPDNLDDARTACSAGYYVNPAVKVVVSDGKITLGIKADNGVDGDWMVIDYFKLLYCGPDNIESSRALLQAAIDEAEAWDASATTDPMAEQLSEAIDAAKAKMSSTDSDEVEAAADALKAALKAAKNVDVSVLRATIALAKKEGVDTSAADEVVATATDNSPVAAALFDLRAARKINAQTLPDIYTGSEPAEGKVYIYNLGTGMFLGTGASYNTHAAVDQVGIEIELVADGDGFKMKTNRGGGWLAKGNRESSAYIDTGTQQVWQFLAVNGKEGVYNISFDGTDTNLLGYNPNSVNDDGATYWSSVGIKREDGSDLNNQWKIITADERETLLEKASNNNPVDVSYLIGAPSLNKQDAKDDFWTKEVTGGNGGPWVDNFEDWGFECWNADNFKLYQTIEGLKPGLYEVSVQAFWREGDGANQVGIVNDGGTLNQEAYLFANDEKTLLPNIANDDALDFVPGLGGDATSNKGIFPNWVSEALPWIQTGAYKTTVKVYVYEDGKLTIGIAADEKVAGGDWTVADNFRLTYFGYDENDVNYERALASIEAGAAYRIKTETAEGNVLYLTYDGTLAADVADAGVFPFIQVSKAGNPYEYGYNLLDSYFTNPNLVNDNPDLNSGHINTNPGQHRQDWEAQVFFQNAEGKYAVRATNAPGGDTGWALVAKAFWTVTTEGESPVAEYSFDQNYLWELEYVYDAAGVAARQEAAKTVDSWVPYVQAAAGLNGSDYISNAKDPVEGSYEALVDGNYATFFHSTWHDSNDPKADHYLQANLPEELDAFFFYFKKRNDNNNNRPTTIVISGSNDGENFTDITTINEGLPTDAGIIDYMSAKISTEQAYKYIRFTVPTTNTGNKTGDHVFFTFSEFYVLPSTPETDAAFALVDVPTYKLDVDQVNEIDAALKAAFSTVNVTYALYDADGTEPIKETTVIQKSGSDIDVPADFTTIGYYDYAIEGTIGNEDCTIKVTRSYKEGLVLKLDDLSNDKAYTIACNRGALLTKNDFLASTAHNSLTEAEATDFAIISYAGNYYLYSVEDGKFVTNTGALAAQPTNGVEDALKIDPMEEPYFMYYFTKGDTNNGLNTNGNDPYGYVINTWMTADEGNKYYMIADADFDASEALAALKEYFNPSDLTLTLDVERYVGYFYTPTVATADFTEALESLGVEDINEVELVIVNPDGTEIANYADYDGWFNAEGAAETWARLNKFEEGQEGDPEPGICVKFFQALQNGDGQFEICDMNGADELGKTYSVTWALKANNKTVLYTVNVTFVEEPPFELTYDELNKVVFMDIDVKSQTGAFYEGLQATAPINMVLRNLGVNSLDDVIITAVQADGTLDTNYGLGKTDGWRDADGSWQPYGDDAYFYVKADFEEDTNQFYEIGGYPGHTDEPVTFTATYAFVKDGSKDAVIVRLNLTYLLAVAYEGTLDQTVSVPGAVVAETSGDEETVTIVDNGNGTVSITYSGFTLATPPLPINDFTIRNVVVTENEDGSKSYSLEGGQVTLVPQVGNMTYVYAAVLTGTQEEGQGPELTLVLSQPSGMQYEIVFHPNYIEPAPEAAEFAGLIKQILSHPTTGVQGEATVEQTVTIEPAEDGKVNVTYSGFTMPVTGAEIPEFTVEGVTVTENEDGSISYLLEENEDGEQPSVTIDRGTGTVTYKVSLEGTQESADATPVLKLVLDNSVIDTVWFGADEKTIDKAIVTAINGINALGTEGTIFDISGRKVEKIQRGGIYIVNGKKVSVK